MSFATSIKIIFIFAILLATGLSGYFIICCKKLKTNQKFLSFGNCFAAGIFLLVGVVHLLGESQEGFDEALGEENHIGYIVAIGGYSLILFIEKILFPGHNHSVEPNTNTNKEPSEILPASVKNSKTPFNDDFQPNNPVHECENVNCVVTSPPHKEEADKMPGIILTCALIVHSIIEGIAAGIIKEESSLIILCVAILIHNIPAAFSLGVKVEGTSGYLKYILMGLFTLSSPLGIAIGIGISNLNYPIIQAIFLSLSAGTFIYIGCTEIIPEQFEDGKDRFTKFTGFMLGFAPLAIMSVFIKE